MVDHALTEWNTYRLREGTMAQKYEQKSAGN